MARNSSMAPMIWGMCWLAWMPVMVSLPWASPWNRAALSNIRAVSRYSAFPVIS